MDGIEYLTSHDEFSEHCTCPECVLSATVADLFNDPDTSDIEIVDALTHAIIGAMAMAPPEYRTYLVEESIIKIRIMMGEFHTHNVGEGWGLVH
jgi:hypothetical protein|tara:strand:+ start:993 stop:1274 length:282 start_codon:yes stop_codon:yes gene_type:complete